MVNGRKGIIISIFLLVVMVVTSCESRKNMCNTSNQLVGKSDMYKIIHFASLAGSTHNSQPWRVEVFQKDSIHVFADTTRLLDVADQSGKELYISIGAFLKNLRIAANCFSYDIVTRLNKDSNKNNAPVAVVYLIPSKLMSDDFGLKDIERRVTLRAPFKTDTLKKPDIDILINANKSSVHYYSSNSIAGKFIAKNELEAYKKQSYDSLVQKELARWFRFSDNDVYTKRDGLTPAGMGLKGLAGFYVRHFCTPDDSRKQSFVWKGIEKTKNQIEHCGGWIVLTHNQNNVKGWIQTGMLYEKLNLYCRKLNLGFHPMNQIVEVAEYESELIDKLKLHDRILFVARVGYVCDYPDPTSLRRKVESFTLFK